MKNIIIVIRKIATNKGLPISWFDYKSDCKCPNDIWEVEAESIRL